MYVNRRLLRTKFLPLFVQRRWLESQYHVRTAHEIFKVQLPGKEKDRSAAGEEFCRGKTAAK